MNNAYFVHKVKTSGDFFRPTTNSKVCCFSGYTRDGFSVLEDVIFEAFCAPFHHKDHPYLILFFQECSPKKLDNMRVI